MLEGGLCIGWERVIYSMMTCGNDHGSIMAAVNDTLFVALHRYIIGFVCLPQDHSVQVGMWPDGIVWR